jgi:hypothetical protein
MMRRILPRWPLAASALWSSCFMRSLITTAIHRLVLEPQLNAGEELSVGAAGKQ